MATFVESVRQPSSSTDVVQASVTLFSDITLTNPTVEFVRFIPDVYLQLDLEQSMDITQIVMLKATTNPNGSSVYVFSLQFMDGRVNPVGRYMGQPGPTGVIGFMGVFGYTGSVATQPSGPLGYMGFLGLRGPMGPTGPAGIGIPGAAGPPGIQGPVGPQGLQGATGLRGATGVPGATGPQGIQGIQGPPGPDGPFGPTGPRGPAGPGGGAGIIPYVIWRPGAATADDHVATWDEVASKISDANGFIEVYVDTLTVFGTATVTASTPIVDCLGQTRFKGWKLPPTIDNLSILTTVWFEAGAYILNPYSFNDLQLNTAGSTKAIQCDLCGFFFTDGVVYCDTWAVAPVRVTAYHAVITWQNSTFGGAFGAGSVPLIDASGAGEITLNVERASAFRFFPENLPLFVGADAVWLHVYQDNSVYVPIQSQNLAGTQDYGPIFPPANGLSASRPASPPDGYMFFDLDLGKPIWWSGSQWVKADGTAA